MAPVGDVELRHPHLGGRRLSRALLCPAVPIQDVGPRHLMVAATHEAQFDLVLHILDVERAPTRT